VAVVAAATSTPPLPLLPSPPIPPPLRPFSLSLPHPHCHRRIVAKKVYIRGYETAIKIYFDAKFFTLMQKEFTFLMKYFTTFIKNMPKNQYEVNQCKAL
jgi:hypothetical protein